MIINGIAFDCLDTEGKHDWLDGWHEASGLDFKSSRDPNAIRKHLVGHDDDGPIHAAVRADELMVCGRAEREQVREARGV